ncbi:SNF1-interacting protein [Cladophialophora chaetospira]|uniref:Protein SIP5 n=1 Tax=Cladophialophora chaetospira TaxID=386627 RepID=A0AA38WYG3_9EURO|nr:SNF1-interacting protein [Cladophialophora chaetospira]
MGNSQTKEARGHSSSGPQISGSTSPTVRHDGQPNGSEPSLRPGPSSRPRRGSRPDFSFLGIGGSSDQDATSLEQRRETKVEREARKAEKERAARLKERERSMKEEHVDGGYLVTQGVYVGTEDFNKAIVRQLMIERRLAPFWRGLNDYSDSWAEHQLMAAARGMPIPPADEVPPELEYQLAKNITKDWNKESALKSLTVPIGGRSQSFQSDSSGHLSPTLNSLPLPSPNSPPLSGSPGGTTFRARAKTLASLATSSRGNSHANMTPREIQLAHDPFVNGQPIEVYLYKDASECPICFLYYPPYLNTTRCCEQPICSECFVQIKRPEPHPPEHEQPDPNAPPVSEAECEAQSEGLLVSEIATCPYCKTPDFGITYTQPPFRRGLAYAHGSQPYQVTSAMSSQTSFSSGTLSPGPGRRRGTSLSASAPEVITTDKIRPDWATKLAAARAHAARRSAAATALHTAAYLMNGQNVDSRAFAAFSRRGVLRRPTLEGGETGPSAGLSALAMLAERHAQRQQEAGADTRASGFLPPPRGSSSRRSRMDDLEDMMMMEAIRLSLASEDERRKKEEKDAKKDAKKKEKEAKKAEKAARKNNLFTLNSNGSNGDASSSLMERSRSNLSLGVDDDPTTGKGKGVERSETPPGEGARPEEDPLRPFYLPALSLSGTASQESVASSIPIPTAAEPFRRSHLRQMSNASSASSSFVESDPAATFTGTGTPPPGSLEPMFNFRSLAAMIGEAEKDNDSAHVEDAIRGQSPVPRKRSEDENPFRTDEDSSADDLSRAVSSDPGAVQQNDTHATETKARPVVEASATVSHF